MFEIVCHHLLVTEHLQRLDVVLQLLILNRF